MFHLIPQLQWTEKSTAALNTDTAEVTIAKVTRDWHSASKVGMISSKDFRVVVLSSGEHHLCTCSSLYIVCNIEDSADSLRQLT